jgi:hypothetical protein
MASTTFNAGTIVTKEWLNDVNVNSYNIAVNAKAYGVVGNGTTDDTVAMQNALNAAANGSLFIPKGTYLLSNALIIPSNIKITGEGKQTRFMTGTSMTSGGFGIGVRLFDVTSVSNIHISHLFLDGSLLVSLPAGHRVIHCFNSTNFTIENCYFRTSGAAVAALQCSDYWVVDNYIYITGNAGFASHDGILDQWYGSHDFTIRGNTIYGNGQGKWGILVTGTDNLNNPTAVYNITITDNKVQGVTASAIHVMGRTGIASNFVVSNNIIDTVRDAYGIAVSDAVYGTVTGNVIRNTGECSIRCFQEGGGITGAQYVNISDNICENPNVEANVSVDPGSAITITDLSTHVTCSNNTVKGTQHQYAVLIGSAASYVSVFGEDYQTGLTGRFGVGATLKETCVVPGGITYSPTYTNRGNVTTATGVVSASFWRTGDFVTVEGIVDIVPTAAAPTDTQLAISLPIASNFSIGNEGVGFAAATDGQAGSCGTVDTTNDDIRLRFSATTTSSKRWFYTFRYKVK